MLMILQAPYQSRFYLGAEDPIDPGGKMICQLRKYLEKLYVNVTILFKDKIPRDQVFSLKIMKILITKGNLTLIPKETTHEHINDLSRKRKSVDANLNHCLANGKSQCDQIRIES